MKLSIPCSSKQTLGGGHTFIRNLKSSITKLGVEISDDGDIVLLTSSTLVLPEEIQKLKDAGKKIVLRVDNMPKNSRNRNTGTSRMKACIQLADYVVFQSAWAAWYVEPLLGDKKSGIIHNGVPQDIFYPPKKRADNKYLYVQYNRDENKRYPEALYDFNVRSRKSDGLELIMLGRFSDDMLQYNFDVWNNETVHYFAPINSQQELANIMRQCKYLYFPAFMDACPNTVIEGLSCGMEILLVNPVGGTEEIITLALSNGIEYFDSSRMAKDYYELFKSL